MLAPEVTREVTGGGRIYPYFMKKTAENNPYFVLKLPRNNPYSGIYYVQAIVIK
jgi:hypothetical protein